MHDIHHVRSDPEFFDALMALRGAGPIASELIAFDDDRKAAVTALDAARSASKARAEEVGALFKAGKRAEGEAARVAARQADTEAGFDILERRVALAAEKVEEVMERLPNVPLPEVPHGASEADNVEVRVSEDRPEGRGDGRQHFEIGESLGLMDFEAAAKLSGSRFVVLKGALARLSRALGAFMLDVHTRKHRYTEVEAPLIVGHRALYGTGQLPKFETDLYRLHDTSAYLIPTAEVSLTNLVADRILAASDLPLRYTALTPCFRSEAGSAGRDTRGMLRQHQFMKCELVSIVEPGASAQEHERMLDCAETILKMLGLPYRVVLLSTGDMGFSACKTYDIEVWLPGQKAYREISSISNCGPFQARRMGARVRLGGKPEPVHTLNGSGVAVGRALIAVLENYVEPDGSIMVPPNLWPYFGATRIEREAI